MDDLLKLAIQSGLKFPLTHKYNLNIVPNVIDVIDITFGVFVSIERSHAYELMTWPFNIHGCIGYWDRLYRVLDKNFVIKKN